MQHANDGGVSSIVILYEDADVVVIDKPSGIMTHPDGRSTKKTVTDWFLAYCPSVAGVGEAVVLQDGSETPRAGVVHRLDTETSGVMVLAKRQEAYEHLKQQFHDRMVEKEYRAFVYGRLKDSDGVIDRPIGRSAQDFRLRSAQRGARGKMRDAVTRWERIVQGKEHAYVRFLPTTGRTHQIRVHAKAMHHPVVCDALYAPKHPCNLGFTRLALHAFRLTLALPNGNQATYEAPLPLEFRTAEAFLAETSENKDM